MITFNTWNTLNCNPLFWMQMCNISFCTLFILSFSIYNEWQPPQKFKKLFILFWRVDIKFPLLSFVLYFFLVILRENIIWWELESISTVFTKAFTGADRQQFSWKVFWYSYIFMLLRLCKNIETFFETYSMFQAKYCTENLPIQTLQYLY